MVGLYGIYATSVGEGPYFIFPNFLVYILVGYTRVSGSPTWRRSKDVGKLI